MSDSESYARFTASCKILQPCLAVVLGSGLAKVIEHFQPFVSCSYLDIPGFAQPSIAGHRGRLEIGLWSSHPVIFCSGRLHYYEGHRWERVTLLVQRLAELGIKNLMLTNAAGGIRPDLKPGDLLLIEAHRTLLHHADWRLWAAGEECDCRPYSRRSLELFRTIDSKLPQGVYASLTGPCYETPAEIRALMQCQVDAVGMSTACEALKAHELGMEVVAMSIITNFAAGLAPGILSHREVEATAQLAVVRLQSLISELLSRLTSTYP